MVADMTEAEVIQTLRSHFESLFPKVCPNCGRRFPTLKNYILVTQRIGLPVSYDAELGEWTPEQPAGSLAYSNCPCGSTLALDTKDIPLPTRRVLLQWLRTESHRRRLSPSQLLDHLRDEIRQRVMAEPDSEDRPGRRN